MTRVLTPSDLDESKPWFYMDRDAHDNLWRPAAKAFYPLQWCSDNNLVNKDHPWWQDVLLDELLGVTSFQRYTFRGFEKDKPMPAKWVKLLKVLACPYRHALLKVYLIKHDLPDPKNYL